MVLIHQQMETEQASGEALAALRAELSKARSEAERQKAMALQGARDLDEALKARQLAQSRSAEVEKMLKGVIAECDLLGSSKEKHAAELGRSGTTLDHCPG